MLIVFLCFAALLFIGAKISAKDSLHRWQWHWHRRLKLGNLLSIPSLHCGPAPQKLWLVASVQSMLLNRQSATESHAQAFPVFQSVIVVSCEKTSWTQEKVQRSSSMQILFWPVYCVFGHFVHRILHPPPPLMAQGHILPLQQTKFSFLCFFELRFKVCDCHILKFY